MVIQPTTNPFKERFLEDIKVDHTSYPGENEYFNLDTSYYNVIRAYSKTIAVIPLNGKITVFVKVEK